MDTTTLGPLPAAPPDAAPSDQASDFNSLSAAARRELVEDQARLIAAGCAMPVEVLDSDDE